MEVYLGIYDNDAIYSRRLLSGLLKRAELKSQTVEFTRPENIKVFAEQHILELVLVSLDSYNSDMKCDNIKRIICLCEDEPSDAQQAMATELGIELMYKYQSLSSLVREILSNTDRRINSISGKQLIAVYSPVHRCGKTLFSLALSQVLGENKPALFISLEEHSQLKDYMRSDEKGDLVDVIYYYLQGDLADREKRFVRSAGRTDYVMPANEARDLRSLKLEEIIGVLKYFLNDSIYSCIVVDVGDVQDVGGLLPEFDRVFVPVIEDDSQRKRVISFLDELAKTERGIIDRIQEVSPPEISWTEVFIADIPEFSQDYRIYVRTCLNNAGFGGQ